MPDHGHAKSHGSDVIPEKHEAWEKHLDYTQKHPIFEVDFEKKGPEFSKIDDLRDEFIKSNAGTFELEAPVPRNIVGTHRP